MTFIETPIFTRQIVTLLDDEDYRELQKHLLQHPTAGNCIPGSGGLRKMRWASQSKGKRGGIRVIYYWFVQDDEMYLLLAYSKSMKDDLAHKEIKVLRELIAEITT